MILLFSDLMKVRKAQGPLFNVDRWRGGYRRGTQLRMIASQRFQVNPLVLNDGRPSPTGTSVAGYEYKLPKLDRILPVRQIRVIVPSGSSPSVFDTVAITLRDYEGRYLIRDFPAGRFVQRTAADVPFFFDAMFFPDPDQSFAMWTVDTDTLPLTLEFVYA